MFLGAPFEAKLSCFLSSMWFNDDEKKKDIGIDLLQNAL